MATLTPSDEEIIKAADKQMRRRAVALVCLSLAAGALAGYAGFITRSAQLAHRPLDPSSMLVPGVGGAVVILGAILTRILIRPPKAALEGRILLKRMDRMPWRRRTALVVLPILLLVILASELWEMAHFGGRPLRTDDYVAASSYLLVVGLYLQIITGLAFYPRRIARILDDELVRHQRGVALQTGFWALMLATAAAYMAILIKPQWAPFAPAVVLYIGVAAPAVRLAMFEIGSGPGG